MRDNGVEDFRDPQIRADGDYFLEPPADVGDEELTLAEAACEHILGPPSTATAVNTDDVATGWEQIVPGGDCQCADSSEFSFWVRKANPERVVLFLQGGGGCWSAETCDPEDELYRTTIAEGPIAEGGVFDFADERNPFADYSFVYVSYCTGDAHIGNTTTEYAPDLTIQHKGFVNDAAALDYLAATFPAATEVAVIGESAGAVASPLMADSSRIGFQTPDHGVGGRFGFLPRRPRPMISLPGTRPTRSRAGQTTPARPSSSGTFRASSSRVGGTTPTSFSPATTTPTTRTRPPGTRSPASPWAISCR